MKVHPVTVGLTVTVAFMMAVTLGSIVGHKIAPESIAQSKLNVESIAVTLIPPVTTVALVQPIRVIVASPYEN